MILNSRVIVEELARWFEGGGEVGPQSGSLIFDDEDLTLGEAIRRVIADREDKKSALLQEQGVLAEKVRSGTATDEDRERMTEVLNEWDRMCIEDDPELAEMAAAVDKAVGG